MTIYLDFSDTPDISAAQRNAIESCIDGKYPFTSNLAFTQTEPVAGLVKTITFESMRGVAWGNSDKENDQCSMFTGPNATELAAFDTEQKRTNLYCETGAHELGHLLCAVHNRDNPPSLMTLGSLVGNIARAADGREFTALDIASIAQGIAFTKAGLNWELEADFDEKDLIAVQGIPEGPNKDEDNVLDVTVELSNNESFEFGYMNPFGEFVPVIEAGAAVGVLPVVGGDIANFALRGIEGSAWSEQVFDMETVGEILDLFDARPANLSVLPVQTDLYYGTALLEFDLTGVGAGVVTALPSFQQFSSTHGWSVIPATPIPVVSEWGLIVMTMLGLTAGTILFGRRRPAAP